MLEALRDKWQRGSIGAALGDRSGGGEFCLQLDAHMFLAPGWDAQLIGSWRRARNPRAVLSTYAVPARSAGFERAGHAGKEEEEEEEEEEEARSAPHLCRARFTMEGVPTFEASRPARGHQGPLPSPFWSGHLSFGPCAAGALGDARYDPSLPGLFWGEEVGVAARLFTHGWDVYSPDVAPVAHDYDRFSMRPWRWDYLSLANSLRRTYALLRLPGGRSGRRPADLGPFGLGCER